MKFPRWFILIVSLWVVFLSVLVFLLLRKSVVSQQILTGGKGEKGDTAFVDYEQIENYIDNKIAFIPVPENGKPGKDGQNGTNGKDGTSATDAQVKQAVNTYLLEHPIPTPVDGKTALFRCKDFETKYSQVQISYKSDETWVKLYDLPQKCEASGWTMLSR